MFSFERLIKNVLNSVGNLFGSGWNIKPQVKIEYNICLLEPRKIQ